MRRLSTLALSLTVAATGVALVSPTAEAASRRHSETVADAAHDVMSLDESTMDDGPTTFTAEPDHRAGTCSPRPRSTPPARCGWACAWTPCCPGGPRPVRTGASTASRCTPRSGAPSSSSSSPPTPRARGRARTWRTAPRAAGSGAPVCPPGSPPAASAWSSPGAASADPPGSGRARARSVDRGYLDDARVAGQRPDSWRQGEPSADPRPGTSGAPHPWRHRDPPRPTSVLARRRSSPWPRRPPPRPWRHTDAAGDVLVSAYDVDSEPLGSGVDPSVRDGDVVTSSLRHGPYRVVSTVHLRRLGTAAPTTFTAGYRASRGCGGGCRSPSTPPGPAARW